MRVQRRSKPSPQPSPKGRGRKKAASSRRTPKTKPRRRRMYAKTLLRFLLVITVFALVASAQTAPHPLKLDDLARFRNVNDPQCAPDGQWVAYVVATIDAKEDKSSSHIWMIGFDGKNDRQITFSNDSEGSARWSPGGKYL